MGSDTSRLSVYLFVNVLIHIIYQKYNQGLAGVGEDTFCAHNELTDQQR